MKKFQIVIVILGFLCYSPALAAVFSANSCFVSDFSNIEYSISGMPLPMMSSSTDAVLLASNFNPDFDPYPNILGAVDAEDINLDTVVDTSDSTDDFEMKDHDPPLMLSTIKTIPASIIRIVSLKTINFPAEVSRLRI